MPSKHHAPGRPRDPEIDAAVLAVARRHLSVFGYDAMSVVAIAAEAGTSRQALYRRWPSKAELATAAIAGLSGAGERPDTDDPYADLVAELESFRTGVLRPNGLALVGSMLQESTQEELRDLYRERIVRPRRARLRHILQRAAKAGMIDGDADIDYAVAACTGICYSLHLAGQPISRSWSGRTAKFVWRSVGGEPPAIA
jgi:AcrR family transcriptional regulator